MQIQHNSWQKRARKSKAHKQSGGHLSTPLQTPTLSPRLQRVIQVQPEREMESNGMLEWPEASNDAEEQELPLPAITHGTGKGVPKHISPITCYYVHLYQLHVSR